MNIISDVHGMFIERRAHHILSIVIWTKKSIRRYLKYPLSAFMHAFNCRMKFYLPILRSFTVAGYLRSPAVLASFFFGSINNKCFTINIKKLSMNKSDRLIAYEVCVTPASSTQQCYSFIYFTVVFSVQRFLNMQKSLGGHTKNSVTFQLLKAIKWRLAFLCVYEQAIKV